MKTAAWICVGVVLGFLIGTIPGRREVTGLEGRVDALEAQLARAEEANGGGALGAPLPGLGSMLRGARLGLGRRHARSPAAEGVVTTDGGVAPGIAGAGSRADDSRGSSSERDRFDPDGGVPRGRTPLERFDLAVDAQRMRASQAREALREAAGLDDAKAAEVDRALARMNERLVPYADELVELTMAGERPRARDVLSLTHDVTGILAEAQAEMDHIVGDQNMEQVDDSAAQIWSYVDLEKFRPAVEAYSAREGD